MSQKSNKIKNLELKCKQQITHILEEFWPEKLNDFEIQVFKNFAAIQNSDMNFLQKKSYLASILFSYLWFYYVIWFLVSFQLYWSDFCQRSRHLVRCHWNSFVIFQEFRCCLDKYKINLQTQLLFISGFFFDGRSWQKQIPHSHNSVQPEFRSQKQIALPNKCFYEFSQILKKLIQYISRFCFQLSFCPFTTISLYRSTYFTMGEVLSDWAFLFLCTCVLSFQEIFMKKPCCKSKKIDIKSCENASVRISECSFRNDFF